MTKQAIAVALRLTIKLYEDEYPLLIGDLLRTRKGQRRAARFATLASIGLLAERNVAGINNVRVDLSAQSSGPLACDGAQKIASDANEAALTDEDVASLFATTTHNEI